MPADCSIDTHFNELYLRCLNYWFYVYKSIDIVIIAKTYCKSGSGEVYHWLRQFSLEKYHSKIIQLGYNSLYKCKQILEIDDFMDDVEIMIPGHRKRIIRMSKYLFSEYR